MFKFAVLLALLGILLFRPAFLSVEDRLSFELSINIDDICSLVFDCVASFAEVVHTTPTRIVITVGVPVGKVLVADIAVVMFWTVLLMLLHVRDAVEGLVAAFKGALDFFGILLSGNFDPKSDRFGDETVVLGESLAWG
jgi:hypothetical protein